jgi:hypothetical protein
MRHVLTTFLLLALPILARAQGPPFRIGPGAPPLWKQTEGKQQEEKDSWAAEVMKQAGGPPQSWKNDGVKTDPGAPNVIKQARAIAAARARVRTNLYRPDGTPLKFNPLTMRQEPVMTEDEAAAQAVKRLERAEANVEARHKLDVYWKQRALDAKMARTNPPQVTPETEDLALRKVTIALKFRQDGVRESDPRLQKLARDYMEEVTRLYPGTRGAALAKGYLEGKK